MVAGVITFIINPDIKNFPGGNGVFDFEGQNNRLTLI